MNRLTEEDREALLLLNQLDLPGKRWQTVVEQDLSPTDVLKKMECEDLFGKRDSLRLLQSRFSNHREVDRCRELGIRMVSLFDPEYPACLLPIYDPPLILYMKGEWIHEDQSAIAIVGTRHPNFYGTEQAGRFGFDLAEAGLTVISGFAKGVDQIAHEHALRVPYGRTIAVLGCGIDLDYPKGSRKLCNEIAERGAVISEFPLSTTPYAANFPKRNRIIAGLALGVLVIQANLRSGSLITAHQAVDQGKDVFSVPGPVDRSQTQGTHLLIKEGANLVESAEDILSVLCSSLKLQPCTRMASASKKSDVPEETGLLDSEKKILNLLKANPMSLEEIQTRLREDSGGLASSLLKLELMKRIQKGMDQRYALPLQGRVKVP